MKCCTYATCRRLTEYRHGHQHCHHHQHQLQPPPQELPPGASAMGSISGSSLGPPIVYNPPSVDWQRAQAAALRLTVEYPLPPPPIPSAVGSFAPNVPPRRCRPVAGDGNCLFRALSWWITGSEEQHIEVRVAALYYYWTTTTTTTTTITTILLLLKMSIL